MQKNIEESGLRAPSPRWFPALMLASLLTASAVQAQGEFKTVPEMAPLPDVVAFTAEARRELAKADDVAPALEAAKRHVEGLWPALQGLDLIELSRWHLEATEGFRLPADPAFEARVLGRADDGSLHVDLEGPRLPANFDIVHRHLHVLAVVRPGGAVEDVTATIRLRIYE
ncbi:MAG: hypothetical protein AAGF23_12355 [Acidobacteriota bacterium]